MSGIYLGFAEKVKNEEQKVEASDINDIEVAIIPEETKTPEPKTPKKSRFFKHKKAKDRESKPYEEVTEDAAESDCFRMFWKKTVIQS